MVFNNRVLGKICGPKKEEVSDRRDNCIMRRRSPVIYTIMVRK
jgi:hypothetical protein